MIEFGCLSIHSAAVRFRTITENNAPVTAGRSWADRTARVAESISPGR